MRNKENFFSVASKNLNEFKDLVENKIEQLGKPTLAIIFVNADLDIYGLNQYLNEIEITHIGASSAGELYNNSFFKGAYVGLFMCIPESHFEVFHSPKNEPVLNGIDLGLFAKSKFKNPGIYLTIASHETQTDLYIKSIQDVTDKQIPLYGGYAFDNFKFEKYTVFSNGYVSNNGVVAVVFDCDKIEITGDSYSGWDSIGTIHTITKSEKNELLEIDNQPALDVFSGYFDYFDFNDDKYIIGNHPLKVMEANEGASLRSPIHANLKRKSMVFYCSMTEGTKFKFCTNPKIEITDNLIERIKGIKSEISSLDGLIITSCASRFSTLGPLFKKEVKQLFEVWNKPMAGFLSAGEIGNVRESNISYFHNVTSVFTGFKLK